MVKYYPQAMQQLRSPLRVLGIETSCDDTGVAIVDSTRKILANCLNSQLSTHVRNGGIIPVVAKNMHEESIDRLCHCALDEAKLSFAHDIDAVAVTNRPGLVLSLQVGLNYAKRLARKYSKPLIPIHHMEAHALMPLLNSSDSLRGLEPESMAMDGTSSLNCEQDRSQRSDRSVEINGHNTKLMKTPQYPFMVLLISGGHCLLGLAHRYNRFSLLGRSLDDAPGDILDKASRKLRIPNLGAPFDRLSGGASIELLARQPSANRFAYFNGDSNVPMIRQPNCDFSFSGYRPHIDKSAASFEHLWMSGNRAELMRQLGDFSASLQRIMAIQIVKKLLRGLIFSRRYAVDLKDEPETLNTGSELHKEEARHRPLDLVVSGGVACNDYFIWAIRHFCHHEWDPRMRVFLPPKSLCSDNGVMIAWNGMLRLLDHRRRKGHLIEPFEEQLRLLGPELESVEHDDLNYQVIECLELFENVHISSSCSFGIDLTEEVERAAIKTIRMNSAEFKFPSNHQKIQ